MNAANSHIYTRALIDAWKRLGPDGDLEAGPEASEYPGLIDNLFVLSSTSGQDLEFRNVGSGMERMFGRELVEHDFLTLWRNHHRLEIIEAAASSATSHTPIVLRAAGATLGGEEIELEFTLAPISNTLAKTPRFLGLCQVVTHESRQLGLPPGSLSLRSIERDAEPQPRPRLRLVVSNP